MQLLDLSGSEEFSLQEFRELLRPYVIYRSRDLSQLDSTSEMLFEAALKASIGEFKGSKPGPTGSYPNRSEGASNPRGLKGAAIESARAIRTVKFGDLKRLVEGPPPKTETERYVVGEFLRWVDDYSTIVVNTAAPALRDVASAAQARKRDRARQDLMEKGQGGKKAQGGGGASARGHNPNSQP